MDDDSLNPDSRFDPTDDRAHERRAEDAARRAKLLAQALRPRPGDIDRRRAADFRHSQQQAIERRRAEAASLQGKRHERGLSVAAAEADETAARSVATEALRKAKLAARIVCSAGVVGLCLVAAARAFG